MPISNSLYVLKHSPPGGEQAAKSVEVIARQVGHLSRLVNDLLDLTRVSRNKIQLQREPADLRDIVRRSVEDQRSLFDAGGIRLDVTLPTAPVLVDVDATRIAQVVGNLLQNAAKFTRRGGGTSVAVTRDPEHGQAIVRVRDSGVGMAPETLGILFQPFVQADQTMDRTKGGLGLGLALVKGLVELHQGEVSARSEGLGKGSEFTVRLPLDGGTGAQPHPPSSSRVGPTRRVLIIEDNLDAAVSLREALELDGHEVQVAHDGREGVALALAFLPEVVLCDIGLPQMDGYEVARALRGEDPCREALLVALSGYALPEDLQRAVDAGFDRHLAKPPSLDRLKELLASVSHETCDSQSITAPMPIDPGR
jgi:two-component system CheB/CheR fusion protein